MSVPNNDGNGTSVRGQGRVTSRYRASHALRERGLARSAERAWLSFRREKVPGNSREARWENQVGSALL